MHSDPQHIVVTGATGFLGSRIVESLADNASYERVVAAGRTIEPERHIKHNKVVYQLGELTDLDYCRQIVKGCSHIVNCASLSSPWGKYDEFYKANVLTNMNLIVACKEQKVKRFVYISTPSMYFNFEDRYNVTENEPLPEKLVNHYAETKLKAEQYLASCGMEYIALRPRAIIGRGDRVIMPRLLRAHREGRLKIIGKGINVMDLTAVSNVVRAVMLSLEAPAIHCGQVYNVTNGEPIRLWEGINYTLRALGLEEVKRKVPYPLALTVAKGVAWWAKRIGDGSEPAIVPYSVANLARSMTLDISKIKDRLGYAPGQTTYEAIDEFVSWFKGLEVDRGLTV